MIVQDPVSHSDSRLGNRCGTLIRHDFKRGLYRALLSELPVEEVKDFFLRVPLEIEGRPTKGREVFRLLWQEKAQIPVW